VFSPTSFLVVVSFCFLKQVINFIGSVCPVHIFSLLDYYLESDCMYFAKCLHFEVVISKLFVEVMFLDI
jgi:hypothetical protein